MGRTAGFHALETLSPAFRWVLVCIIVPSGLALLFLIPRWTTSATITMVALESTLVLLTLGLCAPARFPWALRGVALMVFLGFVAYVVDQAVSPGAPSTPSRRSQPSLGNAIVGLIVIGLPALWYAVAPRKHQRTMPFEAILIASSNEHKVREICEVLGDTFEDLVALNEVEGEDGTPLEIPEPVEDAATFEGNAAIKALYYARATGMICLADDSGLEVDALGGRPGVLSARYSGVEGTRAERDAANNAKLLRELEGVPEAKRTARFVCAMALADPEGNILATTRGTFEGCIGFAPRGSNGFGYDPLLVIDDGRTSAELTPDEKNARSHRGAAARAMAQKIG